MVGNDWCNSKGSNLILLLTTLTINFSVVFPLMLPFFSRLIVKETL